MTKATFRDALSRLKAIVSRHLIRRSAIGMWKQRVKRFGPRSVLNLGHAEDEIEAVTKMQKEKIFPLLQCELTGQETTILDLGCGYGRFTKDLAELIGGKAIGVDPIEELLGMAPENDHVEYRLMQEKHLPVDDDAVDVVWICLVLGGVVKQSILSELVSEIDRVLRPGGLIVLTENTTETDDGDYWKFRSVGFYQALFQYAELKHASDYDDLGERISIMIGRKIA